MADRRLALMAAAKGLFAEWAYIHRTLQIKHAHRGLLVELRRVAETQYAAGQSPPAGCVAGGSGSGPHRHRHRHPSGTSGSAGDDRQLLNRPPQSLLPPPALPTPVEPPSLPALQRSPWGGAPGTAPDSGAHRRGGVPCTVWRRGTIFPTSNCPPVTTACGWIPTSAGQSVSLSTCRSISPASAVPAGMRPKPMSCATSGN